MSPGVSYKLQLQGTCSTDIGVPTAWIVLSSTGYFQVGFPAATV